MHQAELATGDYASVSEIMRAALRNFFNEREDLPIYRELIERRACEDNDFLASLIVT